MTERLIVSSQVIAKEVGDEIVILDLEGGTYFGLDAVGARIWQLIEEGKDLNEICEVVLDEYDVSRENLERDVTGLINDLVTQGIVSTS